MWPALFALAVAASPDTDSVVIDRDRRNGNTKLVVDLHATCDAATCVVWIRPPDLPAFINVGVLRRDGRFETLTPHERFDVLVTKERRASAGEPSHEMVAITR